MSRTRIRAVALRELVAVTVVAALLIGGTSLTTPQLAREKLVAACANNVGRILEGMATWAEENNGMILGSPSTSGSLFLGDDYDPLNPPIGICQVWDWAGPLEQLWGYTQPAPIGERFDQIRSHFDSCSHIIGNNARRSVCRKRRVDSSGCVSRPVTCRSNRTRLERLKEVTIWTEALLEKAPVHEKMLRPRRAAIFDLQESARDGSA